MVQIFSTNGFKEICIEELIIEIRGLIEGLVRKDRRPWYIRQIDMSPERAQYVFRPFRPWHLVGFETRGDALRACLWLSYFAPLALSGEFLIFDDSLSLLKMSLLMNDNDSEGVHQTVCNDRRRGRRYYNSIHI